MGVEVKVRCCREAKDGVRKGKCCRISRWAARPGTEFGGEVEVAGRTPAERGASQQWDSVLNETDTVFLQGKNSGMPGSEGVPFFYSLGYFLEPRPENRDEMERSGLLTVQF